jgi:WD40 repeat protein
MLIDKDISFILHCFNSWNKEKIKVAFGVFLERVDTDKLNEILEALESKKNIKSVKLLAQKLPCHILINIFYKCDVFTLLSLSCVNKKWRKLLEDPLLWRFIWLRDVNKPFKWKSLCLQHLKIEKNWIRGEYGIKTLFGHTNCVTCIQFDDELIVAGGEDSGINIWDFETYEKISNLSEQERMITCLKLTKNKLFSGTWDGALTVWKRFIRGRFQRLFSVTDPYSLTSVLCLAYNNGKYCLTGSLDNVIRIYDITSGQERYKLRGHENSVLSLQFDKEKIVSASEDRTLKVWDARSLRCIYTLVGHKSAVTCLQFKDNILVSGSCDSTAIIWDMRSGKVLKLLKGGEGAIHCLQFEKSKLITGAGNDTLKLWDLYSGKCLHTFIEHKSSVNCLQFNERFIVSGSGDSTISVMDFGEYSSGVIRKRAKTLQGAFSLAVIPNPDNKIP